MRQGGSPVQKENHVRASNHEPVYYGEPMTNCPNPECQERDQLAATTMAQLMRERDDLRDLVKEQGETIMENTKAMAVGCRYKARVAELEQLLRAYVADEDRFNRGDGEPYGSITTETGVAARLALKR